MNYAEYGIGSKNEELSAWLDTHINALNDIMDAACGLKRIKAWKNQPLFEDIDNDYETCQFQSGFIHKIILDGMVLNYINSCQCGFESWSNLPIKKCPECGRDVGTVNVNDKDTCMEYVECACGYRNRNLSNDLCEDCGCDSLTRIKSKTPKKITYLDIFETPKGINETFFSNLLGLMYAVELFINNLIDKEDLRIEWQKIYKFILKRDNELIDEGVGNREAKDMVKQMLKYYE